LIAPEDEPRSARLALLGLCTSLALAAVVALVAWHVLIGTAMPAEHRGIAPAGAVPVAATTVSGPAANAAGPQRGQPVPAASAPTTSTTQANASATMSPDQILQALAQIDPQAPPNTVTVFVVATSKQAAALEQGLLATNAIRATGGAAPLRASVVSVEADPEGYWLAQALAQSQDERYVVVDLR
jgi:hypothetical protein